MEALARIRISGEARQVLDVIIRKTYGFNKKEDRIALSQFCVATGLSKPKVCHALSKLLSMSIVAKKGNEDGNTWRLLKDYSTWKPLPKKATLPIKATIVANKGNASLPIKAHTKDNTTKDNTKDTFDTFWNLYPNKKDKENAKKKWGKLPLEDQQSVLEDLPRRILSEDWKKDRGKYIPLPTTYLNGKRWQDELTIKKTYESYV